MSRVLQDIKTYQPQRPPAPVALKWAYLGSVAVVLSMGTWIGWSYWQNQQERAKITSDRASIESANADIRHFTDLFASLESTKRIDKSRRDWQETCIPASELELALLRVVQDTQSDLRAKSDDKKTAGEAAPQIQIRSIDVAWLPKGTTFSVGVARVKMALSANVPRQSAQIALNKALSRWASKIGCIINKPQWGDGRGSDLTLDVELRQG